MADYYVKLDDIFDLDEINMKTLLYICKDAQKKAQDKEINT